jgi:hypothetical protein
MTLLLLDPRSGPKQLPKSVASMPAVADLVRLAEDLQSDPDSLLNIVSAIAADRRRRNEVHKRSYWHPNGFAKIKLLEWPDHSLRLHVWPAGKDRRGDMNPHCHRWAFASGLILGQGMVERYFAETTPTDPDGVEYDRYQYRRRACLGDLRRPKRVHLRELGQVDRPMGEVYSCTTDVIHTVDPLGLDLLVTAVVQGRAEVETTPVYVRPGISGEQRYRPLKAKELVLLMRDLETAMGAMLRT